MTDRTALLESIRLRPGDDTPRLVYADWLDEHSALDIDRATAEFIRTSCDMRGNRQMPAAAYPWLKDNWRRLVPSLVALHDGPSYFPQPVGLRSGRLVTTYVRIPHADYLATVVRRLPTHKVHPQPKSGMAVVLSFSRGFLTSARLSSAVARVVFPPVLRIDQPLACIRSG